MSGKVVGLGGSAGVKFVSGALAAGAALLLLAVGLATGGRIPPVPGDLNCDAVIGPDDIAAFALAVNDPTAWCDQYAHDRGYLLRLADFNDDGQVDLDDIPGFADAIAQSMPMPNVLDNPPQVAGTVDLDVDSDNDNGLSWPSRTDAEDLIEDDPFLPGKQISVGNHVKAVADFTFVLCAEHV
jgi:hypothetical protein